MPSVAELTDTLERAGLLVAPEPRERTLEPPPAAPEPVAAPEPLVSSDDPRPIWHGGELTRLRARLPGTGPYLRSRPEPLERQCVERRVTVTPWDADIKRRIARGIKPKPFADLEGLLEVYGWMADDHLIDGGSGEEQGPYLRSAWEMDTVRWTDGIVRGQRIGDDSEGTRLPGYSDCSPEVPDVRWWRYVKAVGPGVVAAQVRALEYAQGLLNAIRKLDGWTPTDDIPRGDRPGDLARMLRTLDWLEKRGFLRSFREYVPYEYDGHGKAKGGPRKMWRAA